MLLEDRELNSSRSRLRIEREEVHRFIGEVTDIQDLAVQFHIEKRAFRGDIYVECSFTSDEKFWELNEGDRATVQGHLTEIGDVTKFERCELVSVE